MSHNPYQPPQTVVADAPGPARPRNVAIAVWLLWVALFVTPLVSIHQAVYAGSGIGVVAGLVTLALYYVIAIGFAIWVLGAVAKGRRWSRIVVSILALLQVGGLVSTMLREFSPYGLVYVVELALLGVPLFLLFTPPANDWFRPRD